MKENFIEDMIEFYQTVGALNELAERDIVDLSEIHTIEYAEDLDELCNKYDVEVKLTGDLSEDILKMEDKIDIEFRKKLSRCYEVKYTNY